VTGSPTAWPTRTAHAVRIGLPVVSRRGCCRTLRSRAACASCTASSKKRRAGRSRGCQRRGSESRTRYRYLANAARLAAASSAWRCSNAGLARRRHGVIFSDTNRRRLLRHLQHTLGASAFFVDLTAAAMQVTGRGGHDALIEWRSDAACARGRFRADGLVENFISSDTYADPGIVVSLTDAGL
jgi:hypothetical protein